MAANQFGNRLLLWTECTMQNDTSTTVSHPSESRAGLSVESSVLSGLRQHHRCSQDGSATPFRSMNVPMGSGGCALWRSYLVLHITKWSGVLVVVFVDTVVSAGCSRSHRPQKDTFDESPLESDHDFIYGLPLFCSAQSRNSRTKRILSDFVRCTSEVTILASFHDHDVAVKFVAEPGSFTVFATRTTNAKVEPTDSFRKGCGCWSRSRVVSVTVHWQHSDVSIGIGMSSCHHHCDSYLENHKIDECNDDI